LALIHNLWGASLAIRSLGWPATIGKIVSTQVRESTSSKAGLAYYPCVRFQYSVNGAIYRRDRITGDPPAPVDPQDTEFALRNYQAGGQVRVYYQPGSPGEAILEPGAISTNIYAAMATRLAITGFGLFLSVGLMRAKPDR
jgi:hypothetical protein